MRGENRGIRFGLGLLLLGLSALAGETQTVLLPETPVERQIAPGEVHLYTIAVDRDRYLRLVVEQPGIDVIVSATREDGSLLTQVNSPSERHADEVVSLLSAVPEVYRIALRPVAGEDRPGRYRIRIAELRQPHPQDALRIAAERMEATADQRFQESTAEGLEQALAGYRTALELWRRLGEPRKEGEILYRLGSLQRLRGENHEALDRLDQALALFRRLGERAWQANALNQKGLVLWHLGRGNEATAAFEEALALRRALGDTEIEARILNNVALLHHTGGRLRQAREIYLQALAIFRRTGDRRREGAVLANLGNVEASLGEPFAALRLQEEVLAIGRSTGDRGLEAEALNSIGLLKRQLGEPQAALESYRAALEIFRDLGDRRRQALALSNMGSMYLELGEPEKALGPLALALDIQNETGARLGQAAALDNLGRAYSSLDRSAEALDAMRRALELQRAARHRAGEAASLNNLGLHQISQDRPRDALEPLRQALEIWSEVGDRFGEARARHNLGLAHAALGETDAAIRFFAEALQLRRAVSDPAGEAAALQEMARAEWARGNLEAARAHLAPALELLESLRLQITADRLRSSYSASLRDAYELEIDLLMSLHARRPEAGFEAQAFAAAERARARSLLDLLREARVEIRRGADPGLLEEERRRRIELNAKAERLTRLLEGGPSEEQAADARRELDEAVTAYELAEARLRSALPAYGALIRPEPPSLAAVQALLDADTVLLEYALGEKRSFLWRVTPTSIASFELPARAEIEALAKEAHASLSTPDPRQGARRRDLLARLGRMLLGPVAPEIERKRLAIAAAGALQYLPFAALTLPEGEPVLARHEVVSLPSAAVLGELRRQAASRQPGRGALAIFADPVFGAADPRLGKAGSANAGAAGGEEAVLKADLERAIRDAGAGGFARLPWTRREAEAIAAQAGSRPVLLALDFEANLETATAPDLAQYRVVHFATHGFLNSRHPELSGLVLSLVDEKGRPRDGFLRLPDIYNLDLGAELVVLSGCQTALGKEVRGEGLMGLTRGFFYAGASQVLASLWPVRDRATAELMQRFYRGLFQDGLDPAAALRAAQLSMRQEARWRDPYFWAAFVVQGDWSSRGMLGSAEPLAS